jgi:hypothetical protein
MTRNNLAIGASGRRYGGVVSHTLRGKVAGEAQKKGCAL